MNKEKVGYIEITHCQFFLPYAENFCYSGKKMLVQESD